MLTYLTALACHAGWQDLLAAQRANADWLYLPRGDEGSQRKKIAGAVAKTTVKVIDNLIMQALDYALQSTAGHHQPAPRVAAAVRRQSKLGPEVIRQQQDEIKKQEVARNVSKEEALAKEIVGRQEQKFTPPHSSHVPPLRRHFHAYLPA